MLKVDCCYTVADDQSVLYNQKLQTKYYVFIMFLWYNIVFKYSVNFIYTDNYKTLLLENYTIKAFVLQLTAATFVLLVKMHQYFFQIYYFSG